MSALAAFGSVPLTFCCTRCSTGNRACYSRYSGVPLDGSAHDGLRNEIVADELCAPAPTLENDLTAMKGFEFEAMTETNNGRSFELPAQKLHQLILIRWIEGRGCLIEHDDIRPMEEDSRERQTLFFPAR